MLSLPPQARDRPTKIIHLWTAGGKSLTAVMRSEIYALGVLRTKGVEMLIICSGTEINDRFDMKSLIHEWVQSEGSLRRKVTTVNCDPGGLAVRWLDFCSEMSSILFDWPSLFHPLVYLPVILNLIWCCFTLKPPSFLLFYSILLLITVFKALVTQASLMVQGRRLGVT